MRHFRFAILFCSIMVVGAFGLANAQPAPDAAPAPVVAAMVETPAPATTPAEAPATPVAMEAPALADQPVATVAADPGKQDSKSSVIGGIILQVFIVILTVSLPIILTPLVYLLLKKMKVTDAETQKHIDDMVDKAVVMGLNYAEEQAHKLRDNPVESAEKLNVAADKVLEYLKDSGIVDKGAEYIKTLIESKLGETRNGKEKPATPDA